jgi:hypothetical protein
VSRCAAGFAFIAHGLARDFTKAMLRQKKPSGGTEEPLETGLLRGQCVASAVGTHRARSRMRTLSLCLKRIESHENSMDLA